ncbi:hypothetical protein C2857_002885 [Epichloe festucae Fl1]|uniref:Uncharacterized protein n=1 Tax=Epichloe festucae (strain Fl1) TaxID=877507 RepID=A0A7S9KNY5_EPIFF|nr:hypothetical protein C2857_002885 [Epichloe festucae Fl1]
MSSAHGGSLRSICLLFRLKLGGDVPVGLTSTKPARNLLLSKSAPSTIIYDARELKAVSVIGAYNTEDEAKPPTTPFQHPLIGDPPFPNACFSWAPLERVKRLGILRKGKAGYA